MAKQNIYDNEVFYDGYKSIRENENNANELFEMPALFSLLPDLKDKTILDLGCGFGEHCIRYINKGAKKVTGVDISEKMLETARSENSHPDISYMNLAMENISTLDDSFDIVISSLAMHYIEDYSTLIKDVYDLLNDNGLFVFSQEHPLVTCHADKHNRWTRDDKGNKIYANISDYCIEGEKRSKWFVENVQKYHRMFSTVINTLIESNFVIEKIVEPIPAEEILNKCPDYSDLLHRPDFLIIKAKK